MSDPKYGVEKQGVLDNVNIREIYKEFNNNMRAFIVLRFRHFATFAVIMVFISTAAFRTERLESFTIAILLFGILVTILFWSLDYRTGEYLKYYAKSARSLEQEFIRREPRLDASIVDPPRPRILSASTVTNLIFTMILVGWIGVILMFETEKTSKSVHQSQTEIIINLGREVVSNSRSRELQSRIIKQMDT